MKYLLLITALCTTAVLLFKPLSTWTIIFICTVMWSSVYVYMKRVSFYPSYFVDFMHVLNLYSQRHVVY